MLIQGHQGKWVMSAWKGGYTAASRSQPCAWRHALQIGASVEMLQRVVQSICVCVYQAEHGEGGGIGGVSLQHW